MSVSIFLKMIRVQFKLSLLALAASLRFIIASDSVNLTLDRLDAHPSIPFYPRKYGSYVVPNLNVDSHADIRTSLLFGPGIARVSFPQWVWKHEIGGEQLCRVLCEFK